MSEAHDDRALREELAALREEIRQSGRIPDFETMMAKARADAGSGAAVIDELAARRRRRVRVGGWATLATAAAATTLIFVLGEGPASDADAEFERLVASYAASAASGVFGSPTSGLLDIPGVDLGGVPSVGDGLRGFDDRAGRPGLQDARRDS